MAVRKRAASPTKRRATGRPRRAKGAQAKAPAPPKPTARSERVVVDEIFDNGTTRLLRARRLRGHADDDLSIETWGTERESFLSAWQVEAFVGFPTERKLAEGDVFFARDGRRLSRSYRGDKVLPRTVAATRHLLRPVIESTDQARQEIKQAFFELTANQLATTRGSLRKLKSQVKQRIKRA